MSGRRVLVIAATDSSGGAGLTRDLQTLSAWQTEACCAVTAVTVQTDQELRGIHPMPAPYIEEQIRAALSGGQVGAIKIGMLGTAAAVRAVCAGLPRRDAVPIVLDPVLVASAGGALLDEEGTERLRAELLPRVSLLTPNIPEAAALLREAPADGEPALLRQMHALRNLGAAAVLMKGGHESAAPPDTVTDRLLDATGQLLRFRVPRAAAQRRGTGCRLASAIAAQLAAGVALPEACAAAQVYVAAALRDAPWSAGTLQVARLSR